MNRNLQCLGANLFDEPFFQPDEFGRGPLGDLEPDEGEPRQAPQQSAYLFDQFVGGREQWPTGCPSEMRFFTSRLPNLI
jgi:hypothetical protein